MIKSVQHIFIFAGLSERVFFKYSHIDEREYFKRKTNLNVLNFTLEWLYLLGGGTIPFIET